MAFQQTAVASAAPRQGALTDHRKRLDFLFTALIGSVYTYALCLSMLSSTYIRLGTPVLIGASLGAVFFFHLWFYNKYTFLTISGLLLVTAVTLYFVFTGTSQQGWLQALKVFLPELISHMRGLIPYQEQFQILGVLLVGLMGLVTTLNLRVRFHFYLLSVLGAGVFAIPYFMQYRISETGLILFFFCFLLLLLRKQGLLGDREIARRSPGFLLTMVPVCVAVMLVANLLPRPALSGRRDQVLTVLHNRFSVAEDFVYGLFNPKYFSFQSTGFTRENGRLGGQVRQNNRYVMDVYTPQPVYLRGAVKDTYTGYSWIKSGEELDPLALGIRGAYNVADNGEFIRMIALLDQQLDREPETFYQVIGYQPTGEELEHPLQMVQTVIRPLRQAVSILTDTFSHKKVNIYTGSRRTQNIFIPAFAQNLSFGAPISISQDAMGDLYADALMPKLVDYSYTYVPWNDKEQFDIEHYQYMIHIFEEYMRENGIASAPAIDVTPYLQVPESVPDRVRDLAAQIVGEQTNPYTRLKLLENYLSRYPYTLSPSNVPFDADFVDYFLFEGQEGYCTYYASAFAILARTLGIPTRYLEGYTLPNTTNDSGGYTVTNMEAHAWVEAWLPGIGWYPFEPTRPFNYSFNNGLLPGTQAPYSGDWQEGYDDYFDFDDPFDEMFRDRGPSVQAVQTTEAPEELPGRSVRWGMVILAFAGVAVLLLCLRLVRYRVRRRKLEALDNKTAVLGYFHLLLRAATDMGYPMRHNETALAWAGRVARPMNFYHADRMAEAFSRAAYSDMEITAEDKKSLQQGYRELLARLGAGRGKASYLLKHYFLQQY